MAANQTSETGYPKWQLVALPVITLLIMLICMSEYELIKQALFPNLILWESLLITMAFSSVLAAIAVYFALHKQQSLFEQIVAENQERRRAEEELRRLHGESENLVQQRTAELVKTNQALQAEIVERKQVEASLRASETLYRTLAEAAHDLIFILSYKGKIQYVNSFAAKRLGHKPEEIVGKHIGDLFPVSISSRQISSLLDVFDTGEPVYVEECFPFPDGEAWLDIWLVPIRDEIEEVTAALAIARDISKRKHSEQALIRLNKRLQALSNRLLEVQEQERRHLACELHDQIGQLLTSLNVSMAMGPADLPPAVRQNFNEAQIIVNELLSRVRELSLNLRPHLLDDMGLLETLDWHFKRYRTQTGITVRFNRPTLPRRLSPQLETALYRIVQEALTNVARHAQVTEASVQLWVTEQHVGLEVEDKGRGFNPEVVLAEKVSLGLSGMRERVGLLSGDFRLDSAPKQGTRLKVILPLSWTTETAPARMA